MRGQCSDVKPPDDHPNADVVFYTHDHQNGVLSNDYKTYTAKDGAVTNCSKVFHAFNGGLDGNGQCMDGNKTLLTYYCTGTSETTPKCSTVKAPSNKPDAKVVFFTHDQKNGVLSKDYKTYTAKDGAVTNCSKAFHVFNGGVDGQCMDGDKTLLTYYCTGETIPKCSTVKAPDDHPNGKVVFYTHDRKNGVFSYTHTATDGKKSETYTATDGKKSECSKVFHAFKVPGGAGGQCTQGSKTLLTYVCTGDILLEPPPPPPPPPPSAPQNASSPPPHSSSKGNKLLVYALAGAGVLVLLVLVFVLMHHRAGTARPSD